jgi:hypothetical protein
MTIMLVASIMGKIYVAASCYIMASIDRQTAEHTWQLSAQRLKGAAVTA